jgi:hypothetical protein
MGISSYSQLDNMVNSRLEIALTNTMEEVMDKLHEFIQREVYSYPNQWYNRSMELLNNWDYTKPKLIKECTMLTTLSFSKPITYSSAELGHRDETGYTWKHGMSHLTNEAFLEVVNDGKIGAVCNFPQIGERPFWDEFMKWVKLEIYTIFQKHAKNAGLPISFITVR